MVAYSLGMIGDTLTPLFPALIQFVQSRGSVHSGIFIGGNAHGINLAEQISTIDARVFGNISGALRDGVIPLQGPLQAR